MRKNRDELTKVRVGYKWVRVGKGMSWND